MSKTATILGSLISSAFACLLPYLTLYLRYMGLSAIQCGLLRAFQSLLSVLSVPFWKSNSEPPSRKKATGAFSALVCVAFYLSLTFLPSHNSHQHCHRNTSHSVAITDDDLGAILNLTVPSDGITELKLLNLSATSTDDDHLVKRVLSHVQNDKKGPPKKGLFFVLLLLLVSAGFMAYPVRLLRSELNSSNRLCEKIVASVCVALTACVVTLTPCHIFLGTSHFAIHFYAYSVLMVAVAVGVFFIEDGEVPKRSSDLGRDGPEFRSPLVFLCLFVMGGYLNATFFDFRLWIAEDLGANELVFGLMIVTGIQSRVLASFARPLFLRWERGLLASLLLSYAFYATGFLAMSTDLFRLFFVPIQTMYGFAYEMLGIAMDASRAGKMTDFVYVKEAVMPFGFAVGTFTSGVLIHFGGGTRAMYLYNSCFCFAMLALLATYSLYSWTVGRKPVRYSTLVESTDTIIPAIIISEDREPVEMKEF